MQGRTLAGRSVVGNTSGNLLENAAEDEFKQDAAEDSAKDEIKQRPSLAQILILNSVTLHKLLTIILKPSYNPPITGDIGVHWQMTPTWTLPNDSDKNRGLDDICFALVSLPSIVPWAK